MPLYEYQCVKCNQRIELIQRHSDPPPAECEKCGGGMKKLHSAPAIQFKGSGFYKTDYASSSSTAPSSSAAKSDSASSAGDSKSSSDAGSSTSGGDGKSGSESKSSSESKSETKPSAASSSKSE
jgi:putative FmdB family regulatory protein